MTVTVQRDLNCKEVSSGVGGGGGVFFLRALPLVLA